MLNSQDLTRLALVAKQAATQAGKYISSVQHDTLNVEYKDAGSSAASSVVTQVDRIAEAMIYKYLQPTLAQYSLAWLAEESASIEKVNQHQRFHQPAFWCVDPLDGTLPFTENQEGYAVSVALVSRAGEPLLGVVFDPVTQRCWQTPTDIQIQPAPESTLTFYCDRSQILDEKYETLHHQLNLLKEYLGFNSLRIVSQYGAVKNALAVLETPHSLYYKPTKRVAGGGSLWDFAATTALFKRAQKPCGDATGQPINFNQPDTFFLNKLGVLFCHNEELKSAWLHILQQRS